MRSKIELIVDWEASEVSGDDRVIGTQGDLLDYIQGTLESNANFDHVTLKIKDASITEALNV